MRLSRYITKYGISSAGSQLHLFRVDHIQPVDHRNGRLGAHWKDQILDRDGFQCDHWAIGRLGHQRCLGTRDDSVYCPGGVFLDLDLAQEEKLVALVPDN